MLEWVILSMPLIGTFPRKNKDGILLFLLGIIANIPGIFASIQSLLDFESLSCKIIPESNILCSQMKECTEEYHQFLAQKYIRF